MHDFDYRNIQILYAGSKEDLKALQLALEKGETIAEKKALAYFKSQHIKIDYKKHTAQSDDVSVNYPYSAFKLLMEKFPGLVFVFDIEYTAVTGGCNGRGRYAAVYEKGKRVYDRDYYWEFESFYQNFIEYLNEECGYEIDIDEFKEEGGDGELHDKVNEAWWESDFELSDSFVPRKERQSIEDIYRGYIEAREDEDLPALWADHDHWFGETYYQDPSDYDEDAGSPQSELAEFKDLTEMKTFLADAKGGKTPASPILVKLTVPEASLKMYEDQLGALFDALPKGKFVSVDLSDCKIKKIDLVGWAWDDRYRVDMTISDPLAAVILPSCLKTIGKNAFEYCRFLQTVSIPKGVTEIGESAFKECESLKTISLPKSVKLIGGNAFKKCSKLTEVKLLSIEPPAVTLTSEFDDSEKWRQNIWEAFDKCSEALSIKVPAESLKAYKQAKEWKNYKAILSALDEEELKAAAKKKTVTTPKAVAKPKAAVKAKAATKPKAAAKTKATTKAKGVAKPKAAVKAKAAARPKAAVKPKAAPKKK
jgi:hypothetical protein